MRHNLTALIKDEIVKRFESVVTEEIKKHNIAVEKSNRDISELKEMFEFFKKEHNILKIQNSSCYKETQDDFKKECVRLEEAFDSQRRYIRESHNKNEDILVETRENLESSVSVNEFNDLKRDVQSSFTGTEKKILEESKRLEELIYKLIHENDKDENEKFEGLEIKILSLKNQISELEKIIDRQKVDNQGVLRELQLHKKKTFVLEKKAENLYTLNHRLTEQLNGFKSN